MVLFGLPLRIIADACGRLTTVDKYMGLMAQFNPLAPTESTPLFFVGLGPIKVPFTNHMLMVTIAAIVLALGLPRFIGRQVGGPVRTMIEAICVYLRDQMARPILGHQTDRYIGFVWTVFFMVLTLNLLGMIPSEQIVTILTGRPNHWGGPATANIYVTGGLAAAGFFMTHAAGMRQHGVLGYLASIAPEGPWWIRPLLFVIESLGIMIRPFTLAVRLFANILAGHILTATFFGLILVFKSYLVATVSVLAATAISLLELLVAFIQAFIFAFLSTLYIGLSVSVEH